VISSKDPKVFLDYASISFMNKTLDSLSEPEDLEYRVYLILDHLTYLHLQLNVVNLDIKL
jgi:hypothetical protein